MEEASDRVHFLRRIERCLARAGGLRIGFAVLGLRDPLTFADESIWLSSVRFSGLAYSGGHLPEAAGEILDGLD